MSRSSDWDIARSNAEREASLPFRELAKTAAAWAVIGALVLVMFPLSAVVVFLVAVNWALDRLSP